MLPSIARQTGRETGGRLPILIVARKPSARACARPPTARCKWPRAGPPGPDGSERLSAQHQSLLHFISQERRSDETVLGKVREMPDQPTHKPWLALRTRSTTRFRSWRGAKALPSASAQQCGASPVRNHMQLTAFVSIELPVSLPAARERATSPRVALRAPCSPTRRPSLCRHVDPFCSHAFSRPPTSPPCCSAPLPRSCIGRCVRRGWRGETAELAPVFPRVRNPDRDSVLSTKRYSDMGDTQCALFK